MPHDAIAASEPCSDATLIRYCGLFHDLHALAEDARWGNDYDDINTSLCATKLELFDRIRVLQPSTMAGAVAQSKVALAQLTELQGNSPNDREVAAAKIALESMVKLAVPFSLGNCQGVDDVESFLGSMKDVHDIPSDDFLPRPPVDAFGPLVPKQDFALDVAHDDGIAGLVQ